MKDNRESDLTNDDYRSAVQDLNTFVDTTVDDLRDIKEKAEKYAHIRKRKKIPVRMVRSSSVITTGPFKPLAEAAHILTTQRISTLPVIDENNKLIGLLTEGDFLEAVGIPIHHPSHTILHTIESLFTEDPKTKGPYGTVADIMSKHVITILDDELIYDAIEKMKKHKVRKLVVIDDNDKVKGILSQSDFIRLFFEFLSVR